MPFSVSELAKEYLSAKSPTWNKEYKMEYKILRMKEDSLRSVSLCDLYRYHFGHA